jgi:hypothetical protein
MARFMEFVRRFHAWGRARYAARPAPRAPWLWLAAAVVIGQASMWLGQSRGPDMFYDSGSYLAVANHIAHAPTIFDPLRPPVYPGSLALLFILHIPQPALMLIWLQTGLLIAAVAELALLAWRLTRNGWLAAGIGAGVALNPYVLQWERTINTEGLTIWLLITLCLIVERSLRAPTPRLLRGLALLLVALALTRPFYSFIPALVYGALALRAWRLGELRRQWRMLGMSVALVIALLGGYALGNGWATGYAGLSSASNINLLGVALDCHLQDGVTDANYGHLRADIDAYVRSFPQYAQFVDPWPFLYTLHPEYQARGAALIGAYSRDVILRHPLAVAACVAPNIPASWLAPPVFYATNLQARHVWALAEWGQGALLALYLLLPLAGLASVVRTWRRPEDVTATVLALVALAAGGAVILTGVFSYDPREFYRLRSPLDSLVVFTSALWLERVGQGIVARAQTRLRIWRIRRKLRRPQLSAPRYLPPSVSRHGMWEE